MISPVADEHALGTLPWLYAPSSPIRWARASAAALVDSGLRGGVDGTALGLDAGAYQGRKHAANTKGWPGCGSEQAGLSLPIPRPRRRSGDLDRKRVHGQAGGRIAG